MQHEIEMPEEKKFDLREIIRTTPNTEFARICAKVPYNLESLGQVGSMNVGDWIKFTPRVEYVPNFFHPEFMHLLSNWQFTDV